MSEFAVSDNEQRQHEDHKEVTFETLSTPQVHVKPAPLIKRFAACLLDSALLGALWAVAWALNGRGFTLTDTASVYVGVAYLVGLTFLYYFLLEWVFAASIGKLFLRLRVFGIDGEPCSVKASLKRNLVRFVDWLPFLYVSGIVSVVASSNKQRLGDRVASTIVTLAPTKDINPPPAPFLFH